MSSASATMPYSENGVSVNLPSGMYFQLEKCQAYIDIKSQSVKEMDFCMHDKDNNIFWLIELKGYFDPSNSKHIQPDFSDFGTINDKIDEFSNKAIHSLCMIFSNRAKTSSCNTFVSNGNAKIKLLYIVSISQKNKEYLMFFSDKLKNQLKPFISIFDVSTATVVDYEDAKRLFSWVI